MNHEEKVKYMRLALGMQGIGVNEEMSDRLVTTFEAIQKKGGDFSVSDAVDIEFSVGEKYADKRISARVKEKEDSND